ncbi:MAG: acylphosphatase [Nitrososphaera sp.]|nr:acylphosphatase [Nitrososphaera sp.]
MGKARAQIFISGQVQGVFFRTSAQEKARELGLTGWAKNVPEGKVEIVCEGEKEDVEKFVEWCREGPELARVENVESKYEDSRDEFDSFEVR